VCACASCAPQNGGLPKLLDQRRRQSGCVGQEQRDHVSATILLEQRLELLAIVGPNRGTGVIHGKRRLPERQLGNRHPAGRGLERDDGAPRRGVHTCRAARLLDDSSEVLGLPLDAVGASEAALAVAAAVVVADGELRGQQVGDGSLLGAVAHYAADHDDDRAGP
jgi:hypothetical protein